MTYFNFTFDSTGTAQGTGRVRQTATIGKDKKSYSGSGDFSYFDPAGKVVLAGTFTVTATRIEVQAPAASTPLIPLVQQLKNLRGLRSLKR